MIVECKVRIKEEAEVACRWSGFDGGGWAYFQCGLLSLDIWYGLPKIKNSVLVGLSDRRLVDIQVETLEIDDCRCWMDERNCDGRKEM
mgnify:CR=1 FL=1